jgi:phosphoglycerate dehydrogenase-like enzyme
MLRKFFQEEKNIIGSYCNLSEIVMSYWVLTKINGKIYVAVDSGVSRDSENLVIQEYLDQYGDSIRIAICISNTASVFIYDFTSSNPRKITIYAVIKEFLMYLCKNKITIDLAEKIVPLLREYIVKLYDNYYVLCEQNVTPKLVDYVFNTACFGIGLSYVALSSIVGYDTKNLITKEDYIDASFSTRYITTRYGKDSASLSEILGFIGNQEPKEATRFVEKIILASREIVQVAQTISEYINIAILSSDGIESSFGHKDNTKEIFFEHDADPRSVSCDWRPVRFNFNSASSGQKHKSIKISVLNECFFTEYHIRKLECFGDVEIFRDTDSEIKAIERLKDVDIAIADSFIAPLNRRVLYSANQLKLLVINSTGLDRVDLEAAKEKGITVINTANYATVAVAEHTIALMFTVIKKIFLGDSEVRKKPFEVDPVNGEHRKFMSSNVLGKTLGIIGIGNIGERVASIGSALGMTVLAYDMTPKDISGIASVSLEHLLQESDIVTLHLSLSSDTENFITARELSLMKPTAIIINTARAKLINIDDLYVALENKKIAGVGLDVIGELSGDHPIMKLSNVIFTPHSAWFAGESLFNLANIIVSNVESFMQSLSKINIFSLSE